MRTKREDMKLSKELETIKNLKDEIKSLKTVLAQKKMEVEALDCLIEIIGVHYKANVKNKFRAKAITKLRETTRYSIETLCKCFGCKRDAYYKYKRKYMTPEERQEKKNRKI